MVHLVGLLPGKHKVGCTNLSCNKPKLFKQVVKVSPAKCLATGLKCHGSLEITLKMHVPAAEG